MTESLLRLFVIVIAAVVVVALVVALTTLVIGVQAFFIFLGWNGLSPLLGWPTITGWQAVAAALLLLVIGHLVRS